MSTCSFNGSVENTPFNESSEMLGTNVEHSYEASAIDIVEEQEKARDRENVSCSPQPNNSDCVIGDSNFNTMSITKNTANLTASTATSTGVNSNSIISLMQTSPPPHSYRHSRAYRHFKNPPQPHMCIRTTTETGEELFINVLSWTRIVIPQEPSDPIPLYGGMRVPPGSPRSPPIVFAVMANPEVLKDSGRHSKDPEERRAMVELMCDFVEAMNPGVKLVRNAVILKDRDISGELKDIWSAVQAQRDREREEQMLQQRQQQHYHNVTTQQMFPKVGGGVEVAALNGTTPSAVLNSGQQQLFIDQFQPQQQQQVQSINNSSTMLSTAEHEPTPMHENEIVTNEEENKIETSQLAKTSDTIYEQNINASQVETSIAVNVAKNASNMNEDFNTNINSHINVNSLNGNSCDVVSHSGDQTDAGLVADLSSNENIEHKLKQHNATTTSGSAINNSKTYSSANHNNHYNNNSKNSAITPAISPAITHTPNISEASTNTTTQLKAITSTSTSTPITTTTTTTTKTTTAIITSPPAKKDKLVGFLPNGCLFPRFKNIKSRDKDKEKEKETKVKEKEKNFMHALKKSKDKKVAPPPIEQHEKATTMPMPNTTIAAVAVEAKSQTLINLEHEVQKLDIGNGGNNSNSSNSNSNDTTMFIKLKVPSSAATAK